MADEFEIEHIDHDKAQEVIDWAVRASGTVVLIEHSPPHLDAGQGLERLQGILEAVHIMFENMPPHLLEIATQIAIESVDDAIYEEEQVEEFRQELDEL